MSTNFFLGLDVARSGKDKSACCIREESDDFGPGTGWSYVREVRTWAFADTMATVGRVVQIANHFHAVRIVVDADGIGAPVFDRLKELGQPAVAFHGARATEAGGLTGEQKFLNWRSYAWWHMRELLDPTNEHRIALPQKNGELAADLTCPKYGMTSSGKIFVEKKDEIRKRLDRSPDAGDAMAYCYCDLDFSKFEENYQPMSHSEVEALVTGGQKLVAEYTYEELLELVKSKEVEAKLEERWWNAGEQIEHVLGGY